MSVFFTPKKPGAYSVDKKRAQVSNSKMQPNQPRQPHRGPEKALTFPSDSAAQGTADPGVLPATPTRDSVTEPTDAETEHTEEEQLSDAQAQYKKLVDEAKQGEIDDLFRHLENKDAFIRDLEDQLAKLRKERDNERKAARDKEAMRKMREGEQNDKIRELEEKVDERGNGYARAIEQQRSQKEKALELSESLQSENIDLRKSIAQLRQELDEVKSENTALHDAQDEAEMGEALAQEIADQNSEAALAFEAISQGLEPIMLRFGEAFTADSAEGVLKFVEELEEKASQAKSVRRDISGLSIQSSEDGIHVSKTRNGNHRTSRKASIADELQFSGEQDGMDSGDEDARIPDIPEEDEETSEIPPEVPNGASPPPSNGKPILETTSTVVTGEKPIVPSPPEVVIREQFVVRDVTVFEALQRAPWWTKLMLTLMFFVWAVTTISAWRERRMWLEANFASDMINYYQPAVLESFTGGGLYG